MTNIRDIRQGDKAAWETLWRAYLAFYGTTLADEILATSFARLTDADITDYRGFLAENGAGTPIGLVHFITHRHGWRLENVVYLQDLYVSEEARGTGAGEALIEAVYKAADTAGTPSVYWLTQDFNMPARKLYDRVADLTPFIKYQRRVSP